MRTLMRTAGGDRDRAGDHRRRRDVGRLAAAGRGRRPVRGAGLLQDGRLPPRLHPGRHRRRSASWARRTASPSTPPRTRPRSPPPNLAQYEAVVFLNTTGDVLNATQQTAFESLHRRRRRLRRRPRGGRHRVRLAVLRRPGRRVLPAAPGDPAGHACVVEDRAHAATAHLGRRPGPAPTSGTTTAPTRARRRTCWPSLDESSLLRRRHGRDHPITWCKTVERRPVVLHRRSGTPRSRTPTRPSAGCTCSAASGTRPARPTPTAGRRPATPRSTTAPPPAGRRPVRAASPTPTARSPRSAAWACSGTRRRSSARYSLKLDWRMAGDDNSGVFIGFPPSSDPWSAVNNGYEIQIDATDAPDRTTGVGLRVPGRRPRRPATRR